MRRTMEVVLEVIIELEASREIGAGRYEGTEGRRTDGDGSRDRLLSTKAGDMHLKIHQAAPRQVLSLAAGASAAGSIGALGGGHGGRRPWSIHRKFDDLVAPLGIEAGI
jgi:putative transposase